ncbi:histidine--tRNA ligase [Rhizobacter sp. Root404]|uniref:histidine--tRNA ligase n=1 Tax=Rhizobacter sp. Root404 TaxID=1736528 RepID=UPI0006FD8E41|nr:histidine--tRNA ligase [Rhizobacter sp. Root404]KQW36706.1 histidine--tRNA ligase [Rhizobacter sp. Root404]
MAESLRAVKGMNDILPPESARWEWFESKVRALMARYGYANVRTPIVEPTALFVRGIGEVTDIVEKEMYSFTDAMNGDKLTLRPEATAGIVRAMVEHNALYNGPMRVWSEVSVFRHERPQKGRYRQFHQIDVEALGFKGPDVDAEQILMCRALLVDLGIPMANVELQLNSLGQADERLAHRAALVKHFEAHADILDEDAKRRLHSNPLRILDTKNPAMQAMVESAPQLMDFLGEASLAHLNAVRAILDAVGLTYRINPRLVRGLDYYNLTVFEWVTDLLGSQGTVCGGGRYDGLFEQLGGKPTPAVGWGMGIERMLLLLEAVGVAVPAGAPDVFAVVPAAEAMPVAVALCETLRSAGVSVQMHAAGAESWGSMKSQFKRADASGARHALIFGADELARGEVALKNLRDAQAPQRTLALADVAAWGADLRNA